ncbi:MAG TPA: hypothetical protein PLN93_01665 [Vicinamibacterales bacterium]|nr:hypothetical protein [Vicinamibacterales bacterium]HOQ59555.1 hypothetical protein [Vicinamibacterales bacterium]HPK70624.1 hypothetical protein [Vicinamibacterales bacterium]
MLQSLAWLAVVAVLPGAVLFRLPVADRPRRAALPADERAFWAVVLSACVTTAMALALAAAGVYSLARVAGADAGLALLLGLTYRRRLAYERPPAAVSPTAALPLAIAALGAWLYFPASEYVMGGKDPGTYMNEGIQIAQGGSLTIHDATLAGVPDEFRPLFLTVNGDEIRLGLNQGVRFMGFFVKDRSRGQVVGQFPHAFPAWIALAYGLDGLSGARAAVGAWAILGLLAVYFAGARFAGRAPAFIGTLLLAINVAEVWYAKYPNSELMQQALLFAALLALARAAQDGDRFFAPVAAALLGTLLFVRLDTLVILGGVAAGLLCLIADGKRLGLAFPAVLAAFFGAAAAYYAGPLRAYVAIPLMQMGGVRGLALGLAGFGAAFALTRALRQRRPGLVGALLPWVPRALSAALLAAAAYAYFLREPAGLLAEHDAYALRAFAWYVGPAGLLAAVAGFAAVAWTRFWRDPVLLTAGALVSVFFFYKIRIVPENFWQARRYLSLILPLACLMIASGAFVAYRAHAAPAGRAATRAPVARRAFAWLGAPLAIVACIGAAFASASRPIRRHVEYAGLIPALERLAGGFGDRDLVLVEPRNASDAHVLATPLAYIYARHVLVFASPRPSRTQLELFLSWASHAYDRVFLVADGGFSFASPRIGVTPVGTDRFTVPEYESVRNGYPDEVRHKPFDLYLYELAPLEEPTPTDIDVGSCDNAWVFRMFTRQIQDEVTYRWTRERSFVSLPIDAPTRAIVFRLGDGGRPERAGPAEVQVFLNDHPLGTLAVRGGFADYRVAIPPDIALEAGKGPLSPLVRLVSTTWVPQAVLGTPDDRALGVMVDRIRLE